MSTTPPAHLQRGQRAERLAEEYLIAQGLTLVTRNYRCAHGELDLVMQDRDSFVFVEVRARRNRDFGGAEGSIDRRKQAKLRASALHYLQVHRLDAPCRIDVVAVNGDALVWHRDAIGA